MYFYWKLGIWNLDGEIECDFDDFFGMDGMMWVYLLLFFVDE